MVWQVQIEMCLLLGLLCNVSRDCSSLSKGPKTFRAVGFFGGDYFSVFARVFSSLMEFLKY